MIHTIDHFLGNLDVAGSGLQGLKNDIISSLKRRYKSIEDNTNLAIATLLDPCLKATPFKQPRSLEAAKAQVMEEDVAALSPVAEEATSEPDGSSKANESFWAHYAKAFAIPHPNPTATEPTGICGSELELYLAEKTLSPKKDIFQYWEKTSYLRLKKVAPCNCV